MSWEFRQATVESAREAIETLYRWSDQGWEPISCCPTITDEVLIFGRRLRKSRATPAPKTEASLPDDATDAD